MTQTVSSSMITLMLAKFILNDAPHAIGLSPNPGNPDPGSTTGDIIRRAGLQEYEYHWFPTPEETRPARVYPYQRIRNIGVYSIVMTRTDGSCSVKLYENLEGWKRALRATWTGYGKDECARKFEEVIETVMQVRFEEKMKIRELGR